MAVLRLGSVHGVATVPAVAPPLFRPLRLLCPPILHLFCFVSAPRLLHAAVPAASCSLPPRFPHAATPAAPSSLPPCFPHAGAPAAPFVFGAAPDDLLDEGSPDAAPLDPDAAVPAFMPDSYRTEFRRMLSFIIVLFPQTFGSPSVSPSPVLCLKISLLRLRLLLSRFTLLSFV